MLHAFQKVEILASLFGADIDILSYQHVMMQSQGARGNKNVVGSSRYVVNLMLRWQRGVRRLIISNFFENLFMVCTMTTRNPK